MLFNSIEFVIFFPIVTLLFYALPHKYRWIMLLAASCVFYMFFIPQYIFVLLATILIDYVAAILIENGNTQQIKLYLIISVVSTCAVLFVFKYFNFFMENALALSQKMGIAPPPLPACMVDIILPIGLSFHTFQSLSYVIEVYRGNQKAERHFGIYSLYVMFYPQLVTGPIERPQNLLTQLREVKSFTYMNIAEGLRLILLGLFVKMVIADNLATYVDQVYLAPELYNSKSILLAILLYSFQIYGDFFGYSTIAVGCARAMGYSLMDNFKTPYSSASIAEFWQRWHISLSTWFRDYVYLPLGGNRVSIPRWTFNILIVFVLSGLWHGANWTFLFWGLAHALVYLFESAIKNWSIFNQLRIGRFASFFHVICVVKTFLVVSFIWVLFRADGLYKVKQMAVALFYNGQQTNDLKIDPLISILLVGFIIFDLALKNQRFDLWCRNRHLCLRWMIYCVLIFTVLVFSNVENFPFIYFQF